MLWMRQRFGQWTVKWLNGSTDSGEWGEHVACHFTVFAERFGVGRIWAWISVATTGQWLTNYLCVVVLLMLQPAVRMTFGSDSYVHVRMAAIALIEDNGAFQLLVSRDVKWLTTEITLKSGNNAIEWLLKCFILILKCSNIQHI